MFTSSIALSLVIFIATYVLIISEKVNRAVIAIFGALLMILFHILSQTEAVSTIDFNTIGLLLGMMILVSILKRTGVFQYIAIVATKKSGGEPWRILLSFALITAVASAFLDNVTTILFIVPITLVITEQLTINPLPFLITETLAANIGGAATMIGDPPNIMIAGATSLGFLDFIINLAPIILLIFAVTLGIILFLYRKDLAASGEHKKAILTFDESKTITDPLLLKKSLIVLTFTLLDFMFHQLFHYESATVALLGAFVLLLISSVDVEEVLLEVEWTTLFFFFGLFVLVGGLEAVGLIDLLAEKILTLTSGNLFATVLLILWLSAIASAFLDNIPFVATMIPLIKSMGVLGFANLTPLWWALALGACLGGNGTLIGASANVIVSGMARKNGYALTFGHYFRFAFPLMLLSIILSTGYLILFYL